MAVKNDQVRYVLTKYPDSHKDNTQFCLRFWETVADTRGLEKTWENMVAIISEYKPESITRKRRELVDSTPEQREKEYQTWKEYAHH